MRTEKTWNSVISEMKWYKLNDKNIKSLPNAPGVYIIRYRKPINRLIKSDKNGIIVIGESETLNSRLLKFYLSSHITKHNSHSEGIRFRLLDLKKIIPIFELSFATFNCKSKRNAKKKQDYLFKKYQFEFGELPPLNNSGGY